MGKLGYLLACVLLCIKTEVSDSSVLLQEERDFFTDYFQDNDVEKETLEYLFDSLYPDMENIVELELCDDEGLYYKYRFVLPTGEMSETMILAYNGTSQTEGYLKYELYGEVWETVYSEEGTYKEHVRNSYTNYWYVNPESKDIIPRWIYNEDAMDDASYCIENEEYLDIER